MTRTPLRPRVRGLAYALTAAVLFGASTPFIRPAVARVDPAASAGYLYLGQAVVLSAWWVVARLRAGRRDKAAGGADPDLGRADLLPLLAGIVAGGLIAPGAFTMGLSRVPAHQVSLLLGLESVFTLLIALAFRHERLGGRAWCGVALLFAAGIAVSLPVRSALVVGTRVEAPTVGVLLVILACAGWAVDNNVTAGISGKDPTAIVLLKGWAAAIGYLGTCLLTRRDVLVSPGSLLILLAGGAIGYGLSLRCFILALRHLGAALTTALFSLAPIVGFAVSVAFLGERPSTVHWMAFVLASAGVVIVSSGRHGHAHIHEGMTHEHAHVHDDHHAHEHGEGTSADDGHSHVHTHPRLEHSHPHEADIHHTHRH